MNQDSSTLLLNRLLANLSRSFPQYLQFSRPHIPNGRNNCADTFAEIAADQNVLADRVSQMLIDTHAPIRTGEFPMGFTDKHDLGIDYLVQAALAYQQQDIEAISQLVEQLQTAPAAKSLAEEVLGLAKGHLDLLRELASADLAVGS